jgi:serine/threonine protein kinase
MPVSPGGRFGPYELLSFLGAGGMGEVYRARDTRLGRDVAIKIIAADGNPGPDRLQRFEREARALAALDDPHILAIHDVGTQDGTAYVVFELLEGETLRQRLEHGALAVRKAVELGVQMCRGLAAAHARGIVHRDLKPENLFLTKDGWVKVLDFGLAKLTESPEREEELQKAWTRTATEQGVLLGTVGYMSPEQVRGKPADARSDLFAVGAVLYEMLTGQRAFSGETRADTLSAILHDDPRPLARAGRPVSPAVEGIVRQCLEKRSEDRFQSAHDLALALEAFGQEEKAAFPGKREALRGAHPTKSGSSLRRRLSIALAVLALAAAAVWALRSSPLPRITSVKNLTDGSFVPTSFVTDGKNVYFADKSLQAGSRDFYTSASGATRLMVLSIDGGEAREIAVPWQRMAFDVADLRRDGSAILVVRQDGQLWRIPVPSGTPSRVGDIVGAWAAAWGPHGDKLVYRLADAIYVGDADGRSAHKILDASLSNGLDTSLVGWTPDGEHVRYLTSNYSWGEAFWDVAISSGATPQRVFSSSVFAAHAGLGPSGWTPDGKYFLFSSWEAGLVARRERTPPWSRVQDPFPLGSQPRLVMPRVTPDGRHIVAVQWRQRGELHRYDRTARTFQPFLGGISAIHVDFSRDGEWVTWVSFNGYGPGNRLWRARTDGTEKIQLSDLDVFDLAPVRWSPDGRQIAFSAMVREGGRPQVRLYVVSGGGGTALPLTNDPGAVDPCWAPDGQSLLYTADPERNLRQVSLGTRRVTRVPGSEGLWGPKCARDGRIFAFGQMADPNSPGTDERWVYKVRDAEGEVWTPYVLPERIEYPNWSRDGRHIYAIAGAGRLVRLELASGRLETVAETDTFRVGTSWTGLTPDDSPMVLRDLTQWDICRLDWEAP